MKTAWLVGTAAAAAAGYALWRRPRRILRLQGKVVLITGGSRGLGLAMGREFASRGARLAICARDTAELERARKDLSRLTEVIAIRCDVTDRDQVREMVKETVARMGALDVLVNNAGVITVGPVETMALEDFEQAMDVMFWGVVHSTLAALPELQRHQRAAVVNITSVGGKVSVPHLLPYSCAKFAAVAFSEGLRAELSGSGVNVLTIAPGLMRTGSYLNARFKGAEEGEAEWFSVGASLPGLSMSAARAARQIADALESGRGERILTTQANLAARIHGAFPELSSGVLGIVSQLLPHGRRAVETGAESGKLREPLMRALLTLGRRAAKEYLQPAAVGR